MSKKNPAVIIAALGGLALLGSMVYNRVKPAGKEEASAPGTSGSYEAGGIPGMPRLGLDATGSPTVVYMGPMPGDASTPPPAPTPLDNAVSEFNANPIATVSFGLMGAATVATLVKTFLWPKAKATTTAPAAGPVKPNVTFKPPARIIHPPAVRGVQAAKGLPMARWTAASAKVARVARVAGPVAVVAASVPTFWDAGKTVGNLVVAGTSSGQKKYEAQVAARKAASATVQTGTEFLSLGLVNIDLENRHVGLGPVARFFASPFTKEY